MKVRLPIGITLSSDSTAYFMVPLPHEQISIVATDPESHPIGKVLNIDSGSYLIIGYSDFTLTAECIQNNWFWRTMLHIFKGKYTIQYDGGHKAAFQLFE